MTTKLHIKYGTIELDYEGELMFDKVDLLGLLEKLSEQTTGLDPSADVQAEPAAGERADAKTALSVSDIAQKFDAKTGPELLIAACTSLHFQNQKGDFARKDILATMREATHFFQASYSGNLTKMLRTLVKGGTLREVGTDRYALAHNTIGDLTKRLA
jgi:hypothetical protein